MLSSSLIANLLCLASAAGALRTSVPIRELRKQVGLAVPLHSFRLVANNLSDQIVPA